MGIIDVTNRFKTMLVHRIVSLLGYVEVQNWTAPDALDDDGILNDQATSDSVVTTVTSFLAQPDYPRNVTITPGGTTTSVPGANVVVTGTNIRDKVISENILLTENGSTKIQGNKAFKSITSIVFPVQDGAGATYDVGWGNKFGLSRKLPADLVLATAVDGAFETTRPTVAASTSAIESNTLLPSTVPNGAKNIIAAYITKDIDDYSQTTA